MQIELELESGLIVDIDLDEWVPQNYSDHTRVSWNVQDQPSSGTLDGMLKRNLSGKSIFTKPNTIMRLFNGCCAEELQTFLYGQYD